MRGMYLDKYLPSNFFFNPIVMYSVYPNTFATHELAQACVSSAAWSPRLGCLARGRDIQWQKAGRHWALLQTDQINYAKQWLRERGMATVLYYTSLVSRGEVLVHNELWDVKCESVDTTT